MPFKNKVKAMIVLLMMGASVGVGIAYEHQRKDDKFNFVKREESEFKKKLHGNWKTKLEDGTDILLTYSYREDKLTLSSYVGKYKNFEVGEWSIKEGGLEFVMEDRSSSMKYDLKLQNTEELMGTYEKAHDLKQVIFEKKDDSPVIKPFSSDEFAYELNDKRIELIQNSQYEEDGLSYTFTYDIFCKAQYEGFIRQYGLDEVVKNKEDIELMRTLLVWVGKNCPHDGGIRVPEVYTPENIMNTCKKNNGINARGLAILLSELLRAYGVQARAITCMSSNVLITECNVVVEAYSKQLDQWVMLDPTYRLILSNSEGQYVNLQMLRNAIKDGETLVPNNEASRNGEGFNLESYLYYMSKNVFRFSSAEKLYYGAEEGRQCNRKIELVPVGYEKPRVEDEWHIITTNAEKFWARP